MSKKEQTIASHRSQKTAEVRKQVGAAKASSAKKAAAYKPLAHNEEWLGGEGERSRRRK